MRLIRLVVAVALVAGSLVETETVAVAAPAWSVSASPSPLGPVTGLATAVSCPTATTCFAVGQYDSGSMHPSLIERWNGTNWSVVPNPNPDGATATRLIDIDCISETSCFAVGETAGPHADWTFVERWNGTAWSIVPSPTPPGTTASLFGVSCVSTTSCFAVGAVDNGSTDKSLVERWNGTSWTVVATPTPAGATSSGLHSVSCTTATSCVAIGTYEAGSTKILSQRWNGASWSVVPVPVPAGTSTAYLPAVSCVSPTDCFAAGTYLSASQSKTLVERWNGTSWSVIASPTPADSRMTQLFDISCSSASSCMAVGFRSIDTSEGTSWITLAEAWNGTSWSISSTLNPANSRDPVFDGVSCSTATSCIAVGRYQPMAFTDGTIVALAERWNGTAWSITAPPTGASRSELLAVSCPSTTSCFAVGDSFDGTKTKPLLERWNGTAWSLLPGPAVDPASFVATLNGVSCASTTSCFAVGSYSTSTTTKSLIERWNGTSWSVIPSPNPVGATSTILNGVSCASTTMCMAVGTYIGAYSWRTIALRWNGTSWTISGIPNPGTYNSVTLQGVSCPSTTSCVAVGRNVGAYGQTIAEHWNGTSWSIVASANPSEGDSGFLGVSCFSATNCTAVGRNVRGEDWPVSTLVERWNGTRWKIVPSANRGTYFSALNSVSCPTATFCYTVGSSAASQGSAQQTLAETWSGTGYSIVSTPNPVGSTRAFFKGVSCVNALTCAAVGAYEARGSRLTLVERYA
jgi:hypothetical protein